MEKKAYQAAIADLRGLLDQIGRHEFKAYGYARQLREYRRRLSRASVIRLGQAVMVSADQKRLGGPKFPNRIGTVRELNPLGMNRGGLWYVLLAATRRAKERIESFWGDELLPITA